MITNIDEVLNKTKTIFNRARDIRSKYKDLSDEWKIVHAELQKLFPPKPVEWKITKNERPKIDDFVITVDTNLEFNVLIYKGNEADLLDMWFPLPQIEVTQ